MEYIAYIYDKNNKNIAQIFDIFNINLQEKLNDISTLSFSLYHDNPRLKREILSEYNRVKLIFYCQNDNERKLIWNDI